MLVKMLQCGIEEAYVEEIPNLSKGDILITGDLMDEMGLVDNQVVRLLSKHRNVDTEFCVVRGNTCWPHRIYVKTIGVEYPCVLSAYCMMDSETAKAYKPIIIKSNISE